MSTLYRRKGEEVWYGNFTYQGRRFRVRLSKDKKTSQLLLHDKILRMEKGELGLGRVSHNLKVAVSDFLSHTKANQRTSTLSRYTSCLASFQRFAESESIHTLQDITTEHVEKYKGWRKTNLVTRNGSDKTKAKRPPRSKTINNELVAVKAMLNFAVRTKKIKESPAQGVKPLKEDDKQRRRFLSNEESDRLLQSCDKDIFPLIFFLLSTGCRLGEAVNLEWSDLDFQKRIVKIQRKSFWVPKTGEREIPLASSVSEVLHGIDRAGRRFVFSEGWEPLSQNWVRRRLRKAAKKAGIFGLRVHDLRHSWASRAISGGVNIFAVKTILGHSNLSTTQIYVHSTSAELSKEMEKISLPAKVKQAV
jgi:integrase